MILIVSASNSRVTNEKSISSQVSKMLKSKISNDNVEEVRLKDYNIHPCQLCLIIHRFRPNSCVYLKK
jgi:hypothetical protein